MRLGFAISMFLHSALLAWALVSFAEPREFKVPEPEPVSADVITESDLVKIRQGSRTATLENAMQKDVLKPDEAQKDTPKPKPVQAKAEPPPPAAEPEVKPPEPEKPAEPPPPAAAPKEAPDQLAMLEKLDEAARQEALEKQRTAEAAAKAKAKAEADAKAQSEADAKAKAKAKAVADAKAKAKAKAIADAKAKAIADAKEKTKAESARLSALIDKAPDPKQAAAAAPAPAVPTTARGPVKGSAEGRDAINAGKQGLLGKIVDKVKTCWNIQAGGSEASSQVPVIRFELNRDGSIRGEPRVMNYQSSPQFQLAADAAKRALIECQKYELPADKYDQWKLVTLEFDPREMFQ